MKLLKVSYIEQITRSLAAKAFQTSLPLCKETFFSTEMENQVVLRLAHENFQTYCFLTFWIEYISYHYILCIILSSQWYVSHVYKESARPCVFCFYCCVFCFYQYIIYLVRNIEWKQRSLIGGGCSNNEIMNRLYIPQ